MKQHCVTLLVSLVPLFWACTSPVEPELCGNGELNFGEDCDGLYVRASAPYTCAALGYNSPGKAQCSPTCQIDPAPCVASGMCGDGFMTPGWEQCDGKDNGGQTCESLGHHAGPLFCTPTCHFDVSSCVRCGDGVVQEEYGEVLESGVQACLEAGYLGGQFYTHDCLTPSEDLCGEYALMPTAGSLSRPQVALRPDGSILLAGRATAAFDGFSHPQFWCPVLTEVFDLGVTPPVLIGYRHDPVCEVEFLARRPDGEAETIAYEREEAAPIVHLQDLDEAGLLTLRKTAGGMRLDRVNEAGQTLRSSFLPMNGRYQTPQFQVLSGGTVGISEVDEDGLRLAVYDPDSGAVRMVGTLPQVSYEGKQFRPDPSRGHRIVWVSEREWHLLSEFIDMEGPAHFSGLLHLGATLGQLEVLHLASGNLPVPLYGQKMLMRLVGDHLEVKSAWQQDETASVTRRIFSLEGEELDSNSFTLPVGSVVEALFVDEDGGVVAAGTAPAAADPDPAGQRCRLAKTSLATWRLDASLGPIKTQHFRTTAARSLFSFSAEPDFCNGSVRSYALRHGTLVVAGTYDLNDGFCSDRERRSTLDDSLPVHACGVYVVRFGADGASEVP